jgi:predicted TIM-barrel fold metal-dependent hydrolase
VVEDIAETVIDPVRQSARYIKGGNGPVTDWWVYEDLAKPVPQVSACAGFEPEEYTAAPIRYADMRPGCWDPAARLADMDINRTERSLSFPNISRFAGQMFLEAKDKDLAMRCVKAYNDWMIEEWCGDSGGRLIPLGIVPLWDPVAAGEEIRRNAARNCKAVTFTEMPSNLGLPSIHDPSRHWDPFFAACEETGTVLCMHIGSGSRMAETSPYAPHMVITSLTFANAQLSLVEWLFSGQLARFPGLKIAYSESQIGWMPFILERIDKVWHNSRHWAGDAGLLDRPPSTYVDGRVFGCFFDDDTGIKNRGAIGIKQLLFEVDYPHQDSTWPNTTALVQRMAEQVEPHELEMIVRTNALDMLGLPH